MNNSVKTRKMLSKRYISYLAYIINNPDEAISGVKDTPVAQ